MIIQKVKYGDIEKRKWDFRGCFYNLVVKVGYFFRIIIKRSPKIAILVKKYEILDFGGSFDKSSIFLSMNVPQRLHHSPFHRLISARWRKWKVF